MPRQDELSTLLQAARQLAKLCEQGAALATEARDHRADAVVMMAARKMSSELLRTKHAAEDVLASSILDCTRCGRRVHWVPGDGCARALGASGADAPPIIGRGLGRGGLG
jgi:uncharacterized protein YbjT (DUF2867 family)